MAIVVDTAVFPPGYCIVTGRSQGPHVDTGSDFHGHGRVYISTLALQQLAVDFLGLVDGADLAQVRQENQELKSYVAELETFQEAVFKVFTKLDRKVPKRRPAKAVKAPERIQEDVAPFVEPPSPPGPGPRFGNQPKVKEFGDDAEGTVIPRGVAADLSLGGPVDPGNVGGPYSSTPPVVEETPKIGSQDMVRPEGGVTPVDPQQAPDEIKTVDGEIQTDKPDDVKPVSEPTTPDPTAKTADTRGTTEESAKLDPTAPAKDGK